MGWWSSDILGGDTPLDAVGELEKTVGWDYDKRGGFIYSTNLAEQANKCVTGKTNWAKVQRLVRKMSEAKYEMSNGSVLAVIHVLMAIHAPITGEMAKIARDAVGQDEWGREGDQRRLAALEDFRVRLDACADGKPPKKRKFVVRLERRVESIGYFEVEAISPKEAEEVAKEAAKDATTVESTPGWLRREHPGVWVTEGFKQSVRCKHITPVEPSTSRRTG